MAPAQTACPDGQVNWQTAPVQTSPAPHATPHAPQFAPSLERSAQYAVDPLAHAVVPAAHFEAFASAAASDAPSSGAGPQASANIVASATIEIRRMFPPPRARLAHRPFVPGQSVTRVDTDHFRQITGVTDGRRPTVIAATLEEGAEYRIRGK